MSLIIPYVVGAALVLIFMAGTGRASAGTGRRDTDRSR